MCRVSNGRQGQGRGGHGRGQGCGGRGRHSGRGSVLSSTEKIDVQVRLPILLELEIKKETFL